MLFYMQCVYEYITISVSAGCIRTIYALLFRLLAKSLRQTILNSTVELRRVGRCELAIIIEVNHLLQMDPRDALRPANYVVHTNDAQCDKQATVVGRLLTTLATVDVPSQNFSNSTVWEKL